MRNFRIYLDDIIDAMEKIELFTAGLSFEEFRSDEKTISAVRDKLIFIGESAKKIPAEAGMPTWKSHGGTWQECGISSSTHISGPMLPCSIKPVRTGSQSRCCC